MIPVEYVFPLFGEKIWYFVEFPFRGTELALLLFVGFAAARIV